MRKTLFLCVLALSACVRTARDPATGKVDVDVESPTKTGEDWRADLKGQSMYTSVSGHAMAKVAEGMTNVEISLQGATSGGSHPWHVHDGKCGSGGAIVGDPGAYPPLTVTADGKAQSSAHVMRRLDEAKDYHVNVHASSMDLATIVACGNLDD